MSFKFFKFFFFLLIGLFLLKWVYDFFGSPDSIKLINENKSNLHWIIFAHIPTLYFDAIAWQVFIKNKRLSILWTFLITWVSQASGKFFPTGTISGEFIRVYLGVKRGLTIYESSSTVFADLIIATFSLFLISIFSLLVVTFDSISFFNNQKSLYLYVSIFLMFLGCIFFYFFVKLRLIKFLLKKENIFGFRLNKKNLRILFKIDFSLFLLSRNRLNLLKALLSRLLGWIAGAFEIYVFLFIIGVDASLLDVILIEAFTGIVRAVAFFIPAGLGVQELAFVLIGNYVGLGDTVAFSIAIGRRIREIIVGVPAVLIWIFVFYNKKEKRA